MSWKALIDPISTIIDKIVPDAAERDRLKAELAGQAAQGKLDVQLAQIGVNAESAKHESLWVAGARPFIIWVCGFGFLVQYAIGPLLRPVWDIGTLDMSVMIPVLGGILGLGALRTVEKRSGANLNR